MKIFSIDDPNDLCYPLDKETYNDPAVYYHGTSKQFSTSIEEKGFHLKKVYDQTDVSNLYNAFSAPYFKTVDFEEMDYQKEDLTWAIGGASNSISFTRDYWFARSYSVNPGGESIEKIVKICEFFSKLPDCPFQGLAEKCLKKYGPIFENHVPCVYVVRLPDHECKNIKIRDKDYRVHNNVSNESIIARIDFSREIKKWFTGHHGDPQFRWSEN